MSTQQDFHDKTSEFYRYYTTDFANSRDVHWFSIYLQTREMINDKDVHSVLEFGMGRGVTKAIVRHFNIEYCGVDYDDKRFCPDVVSTIENFTTDKKYDLVCAFQTLEHNPLEKIPEYIRKMATLSNKYVYISMPYCGRWVSLSLNLNLYRINITRTLCFTWERLRKVKSPIEKYKKEANPYAPHWWEVGDSKFTKKDVRKMFKSLNLEIVKEMHNPFYPYHIFYLLKT
jgi:hypothetical protein